MRGPPILKRFTLVKDEMIEAGILKAKSKGSALPKKTEKKERAGREDRGGKAGL